MKNSFLRQKKSFQTKKKELRSKSQNLTHPLTSMTLQDPNRLIAKKLPNDTKQRTYLVFCKDNFGVKVGSYKTLQRQTGRKYNMD